jgi:hypothetical protein
MSKETEEARALTEEKSISNDVSKDGPPEISDEVRKAMRSFTHPETGDPIQVKGVDTANPPKHETGSLSDKK